MSASTVTSTTTGAPQTIPCPPWCVQAGSPIDHDQILTGDGIVRWQWDADTELGLPEGVETDCITHASSSDGDAWLSRTDAYGASGWVQGATMLELGGGVRLPPMRWLDVVTEVLALVRVEAAS